MLIQSSFSRVVNSVLEIPLWNRAPLNLSNKTRAFLAALEETSQALPEMVLSTFAPEPGGIFGGSNWTCTRSPGCLRSC